MIKKMNGINSFRKILEEGGKVALQIKIRSQCWLKHLLKLIALKT